MPDLAIFVGSLLKKTPLFVFTAKNIVINSILEWFQSSMHFFKLESAKVMFGLPSRQSEGMFVSICLSSCYF